MTNSKKKHTLKGESYKRNERKKHILLSKYKEHRGKEHSEIKIENTIQKVDEKQTEKRKPED